MSRENVHIVREAWDAWRRGDSAWLFEFYDPDIEWDMSHSNIPDMGVFSGHDGIRAFFREWGAFFAKFWGEAQEFIDAGDNVIVRVHQGGRGRVSTVDVEMPAYWQLYRLRDSRAVRVEIYRDWGDASRAAGLSSQ